MLTPGNLRRLQVMPEAFDERAPVCEVPTDAGVTPPADGHTHNHEHSHARMTTPAKARTSTPHAGAHPMSAAAMGRQPVGLLIDR